jgi:hypothetical protein
VPVDGTLRYERGTLRDPVLDVALLDRLEALKDNSAEPVFAEIGEKGSEGVLKQAG